MARLEDGARQLPLRHLSIRVPWNDTDWTGRICRKPADNISCLILKNISERKEDGREEALANTSWQGLEPDQLPPCVGERGGFMAPYEFTRHISHPYSKTSKAHAHFLPTPFRYPPYSAACVPFAWTLLEGVEAKVEELDLGFVPELEKEARDGMGFDSTWVQTKHNQLVLLDTFFGAIKPQRSLCFFYAKRTPLVEDNRRVLIGAGWVTHVGDYVEYSYSQKLSHDSVIWERSIQHSIRPGFVDGFLLPYHGLLEYLAEHPEDDPNQYMAFVPDELFWSFSYGSEHVTNDGAIAALLSCAKATENIERVIPGSWHQVQTWIANRLNELWKMRGPHPGLGAALTAFGIQRGTLLAYELEGELTSTENRDLWPQVEALLQAPNTFPERFSQYITPTVTRKWQSIREERKNLLKLLSRFELTVEQATCYYVHEDSRRRKILGQLADSDILNNPYLLYESDRLLPEGIRLPTIDRGMFPDISLRDTYPVAQPSRVDDPTDPRRVRAYVVSQLEWSAEQGHTLQARAQLINKIRDLEVQPACPVDGDLMDAIEEEFTPVVSITQLNDGEPAYQLIRLTDVGEVIRKTITRRMQGQRHQGSIPWRERLDEEFKGEAPEDDEDEQRAREEKASALAELFSSRFSVLIGPAGTGKTTLLKLLCNEPQVKEQGVLLLAPTGKARVRMEIQTGIIGAKTIGQFLLPLDRYDFETGLYHLSAQGKYTGRETVIIDEASMMTEEQLAAVIDALGGVKRLILVGDPRQLPPIGAGRPFLDIVQELVPDNINAVFPRVSQGYAELTVRRRQKGHERDDLLLAEWFSGRSLDPGADEIWARITDDEVSEFLRFVEWNSQEELQDLLIQLIVEELGLENSFDITGFETSLGGSQWNNGPVLFWAGRDGKPGACSRVERWQILSPVRNDSYGVESINRHIQSMFRSRTKERALFPPYNRKIPKPMGREGILYGDKVINLRNHWHKDVWPSNGALKYVANGEIGIVVGQYKTKNFTGAPWKIEVELSSQPSFKYGYGPGYFVEESEPILELAYALTVHKVQGSEFGTTFLVVPYPCRILSRELLYTALTRQQDRVVILHQGNRRDLMRYSSDFHSEAARRLTNLFHAPEPVEWNERFLEKGLIHRTSRGEGVRSKSEVIIANILNSRQIDYVYEKPLIGRDGKPRFPDFTFEDDEMGFTYYWEHLGMLGLPTYRRRWERKLEWYCDQGIMLYESGGGPEGILLTTQDDERGGIQADDIEALLNQVLT